MQNDSLDGTAQVIEFDIRLASASVELTSIRLIRMLGCRLADNEAYREWS